MQRGRIQLRVIVELTAWLCLLSAGRRIAPSATIAGHAPAPSHDRARAFIRTMSRRFLVRVAVKVIRIEELEYEVSVNRRRVVGWGARSRAARQTFDSGRGV